MKTSKIVSKPAETDLDEIWYGLARHGSLAMAERVIDEIMSQIALVARMPESGRARPDVGEGMRSIPAGDYLIYYRLGNRAPRVRILRVLHGMRRQNTALRGRRPN